MRASARGRPPAAGGQGWHAAGRQVSRNEKGIEIFSAARQQQRNRRDPETDEQDRSWRNAPCVAYVWDLSQTHGQPPPAPAGILTPPEEALPGLWDCLCWLARREGFVVEREPGCPEDGTILRTARRIRVLPGLASGQAVSALARQLGHVLLYGTSAAVPGADRSGCQGVLKAEADSVAFIICTRRGDPGRRAGPRLLPRNAHRSLPRPRHAARPRRARHPRRVHRPRPPRRRR